MSNGFVLRVQYLFVLNKRNHIIKLKTNFSHNIIIVLMPV